MSPPITEGHALHLVNATQISVLYCGGVSINGYRFSSANSLSETRSHVRIKAHTFPTGAFNHSLMETLRNPLQPFSTRKHLLLSGHGNLFAAFQTKRNPIFKVVAKHRDSLSRGLAVTCAAFNFFHSSDVEIVFNTPPNGHRVRQRQVILNFLHDPLPNRRDQVRSCDHGTRLCSTAANASFHRCVDSTSVG